MQESCYKLSYCLVIWSEDDGFTYELVISQEVKNMSQFTSNSVIKLKSQCCREYNWNRVNLDLLGKI